MLAVKVVLLPWQMVFPWLLLMPTVGVTGWLTVMAIGVEVAVCGLAQLKDEVSWTDTCCPFVREEVVKVKAVWPETAFPLILQIYPGLLPPLVGLAVKVMLWSAQIAFEGKDELTDTAGTRLLTRLTVIAGEVAVIGLAQGSLEVSTTEIWSLLLRVDVV